MDLVARAIPKFVLAGRMAMHIVIEFYRTRDRDDAQPLLVGRLLKQPISTTQWRLRDFSRKRSTCRNDPTP